jgi:hypothetical protein
LEIEMNAHCLNCGQSYDEADIPTSYFFESATYPIGSYASAAMIIALDEPILHCPHCPGQVQTLVATGDAATPSGTDMATGDDRYTIGDETNPEEPTDPADVTHGGSL